MIDIPTLFILGAGASKPYGYPTGSELRRDIISNFYRALFEIIKSDPSLEPDEKSDLLRKAQDFVINFSKSSIESIDKFLALNPRFSFIGKIAITLSVLSCEQRSNFREEMIPSNNSEDWYTLLFNRMISPFSSPTDIRKFPENKIAFITFNYDRSFDYFLFDSFFNAFSEHGDIFLDLNWKKYLPFPIIHVYGQVDKIEWLGGSEYKNPNTLKFKNLLKLSNGIRVVNERISEDLENIKKLILEYKRIFFLGFGYANENLNVLDLPKAINDDWDIYGTAKGMTKKEIDHIKSLFTRNFINKMLALIKPRIEDKNSYELLREYL